MLIKKITIEIEYKIIFEYNQFYIAYIYIDKKNEALSKGNLWQTHNTVLK